MSLNFRVPGLSLFWTFRFLLQDHEPSYQNQIWKHSFGYERVHLHFLWWQTATQIYRPCYSKWGLFFRKRLDLLLTRALSWAYWNHGCLLSCWSHQLGRSCSVSCEVLMQPMICWLCRSIILPNLQASFPIAPDFALAELAGSVASKLVVGPNDLGYWLYHRSIYWFSWFLRPNALAKDWT